MPASRAFARHALVTLSALVASARPNLASAGCLATVTAVPGVSSAKVWAATSPELVAKVQLGDRKLQLACARSRASGRLAAALRQRGGAQL